MHTATARRRAPRVEGTVPTPRTHPHLFAASLQPATPAPAPEPDAAALAGHAVAMHRGLKGHGQRLATASGARPTPEPGGILGGAVAPPGTMIEESDVDAVLASIRQTPGRRRF